MSDFRNDLKNGFSIKATALLAVLVVGGALLGLFGVQAITANSNDDIAVNCDGVCVALTPEGMNPNEIAVAVGEYVQFNSADGQSHNISEGDGAGDHNDHDSPDKHDHVGGYVSGEFGADEAWRVQFNKPGTYKLHDHYNPDQSILVVVYEPKAS